MVEYRIAVRYARALLQLAIKQQQVDAVYEDVLTIEHACIEHKKLLLVLKNPLITQQKKQHLLLNISPTKQSSLTERFLELLSLRRREMLLLPIVKVFIKSYKRYRKIQEAHIATPQPLPEDLKGTLIEKVKQLAKCNEVELIEHIDASLIGGYVLRVGDQQVDESLKGKLHKLQEKMEIGR